MNLKAISSPALFFTDNRVPKAIFILGVAPARTVDEGNTLKGSFTSDQYLQKILTIKNLFL